MRFLPESFPLSVIGIKWDAINHPASWSPTNRIDTVAEPTLYPDIMRHAKSLSTKPIWLNKDQVIRPGRQQAEHLTETKVQMGRRLLARLGECCRTVEDPRLPWPLHDRRIDAEHLEITITAP